MYEVFYERAALRRLARLPRNLRERIRARIKQLAKDPYAPNPNSTKLQGRTGYRLRVGDWRVIYDIEDGELIIYVIDIAPRGSVYQ